MTLHLRDFVSNIAAGYETELQGLPGFPVTCTGCLLCGPPSSGKTTLLFNYAAAVAGRGKTAICLLRRDKIEQCSPLPPAGKNLADDAAFELVKLKYVESTEDLLRFAACMHLLPEPPGAILVDDLSEIMGPSSYMPGEVARVLAFLADAANHATNRGLSSSSCTLVVTEQVGSDGPKNLFVYRRWLPVVLTLVPDGADNLLTIHPLTHENQSLDRCLNVQIVLRVQQSAICVSGVK
uniref:Uncharacterized protein n=2 Tax=Tetraselmis chuii TaxID=63592 RepID=A0A7S1SLT2_9CHLO|mmetsp:Transcript_18999/g.33861  ORF Transcript_18999/g.33861 Transcript_18999/m.33861 type:complete len:237 (+) Transcript_18999:233-943(+)